MKERQNHPPAVAAAKAGFRKTVTAIEPIRELFHGSLIGRQLLHAQLT